MNILILGCDFPVKCHHSQMMIILIPFNVHRYQVEAQAQ